jgi:hypothetical protein
MRGTQNPQRFILLLYSRKKTASKEAIFKDKQLSV